MPSSRGSSQLRDQTSVSCFSCIAGRLLTTEPWRKTWRVRHWKLKARKPWKHERARSVSKELLGLPSLDQLTYKWPAEVWAAAAAAAKSLQSCPTLCDPIDDSPPGSPGPGILQARTLEWVAISFSNACKWKVKVKLLSRVQLLATPWTAAHQAPPSMGFSSGGAISFSDKVWVNKCLFL